MAHIYVRSTDGNNADNGSTWALAKATLAGAMAIAAAGDIIWLSQAHSETTAGAITIQGPGTAANPILILCGDDSAEPPTALATSAIVANTGGSNLMFIGGFNYIYGVTFTCSTSGGISLGDASKELVLKSCSAILTSSVTAVRITGGNTSGITRLIDCGLKFGNATQGLNTGAGRIYVEGGSVLISGGTSPTAVFLASSTGSMVVDGFDLSNCDAAVNIFGAISGEGLNIIRNSKLPASWSGAITSALSGAGKRAEMHNCDAGATNYRFMVGETGGVVSNETTIVRTGGASDGSVPFAWKMVSTANVAFPVSVLKSPEQRVWNDDTGSSVTVTVHVVHDSQGAGAGSRFTDAEAYLEVMYLSASGAPLGAYVSDAKATVIAAAADQADSSESWTTTGLTTPVKQQFSVSFTPQMAGYVHARIVLAKASKTLYVCPKLVVT